MLADEAPRSAPPSADEAQGPAYLEALAAELDALRLAMEALERRHSADILRAAPGSRASARNLVHYLALRSRDIRPLQDRLARAGLSSLGRSEPHVLVAVERVRGLIARALGRALPGPTLPPPVGFREGPALLTAHATSLLGPPPPRRSTRILVTLPTQAADDAILVSDMAAAGMDGARINLAHDDPAVWSAMVERVRAVRSERPVRVFMDLPGPKLRTGPVVGASGPVRVGRGDRFLLAGPVVADRDVPALVARSGCVGAVRCDVEAVFRDVRVGQPLALDDGKVAGRVSEAGGSWLVVDVTRARRDGVKLKEGRGINLPETALSLPALGVEDRADLDFVVEQADAVSLSFVRTPEDVQDVLECLRERGGHHLGLVLKIETVAAFEHLPAILFEALSWPRVGLMIARGDLAVEAGFERLAEVQEELLWIAEAAHLPTIWATQVLESLAKRGLPSRAEITDAAMSGRAECVMLNKGPYIVEAIATLDDILRRMDAHQRKKRTLLRSLSVSGGL